jgi:hypothetical protein
MLFLEASLEVISRANARVNNGSDCLPPGEAAVRIGMRGVCPAVSGEKFFPTENAAARNWKLTYVCIWN